MSFEDDEYWDEEYSDNSSYAENAAVARDPYAGPRGDPDSSFRRAGGDPAVRRSADATPAFRGRADADPARRGASFGGRPDAQGASFRSRPDADPARRGGGDGEPRRPRSSLGPIRTSTWDGEIADPVIDLDADGRPADGRPADELAARRKKRSRANNRAAPQPPTPAPSRGGDFDTARPDWLDDPDFVPTDTSQPLPDSEVVDFNRPEFGADFDNPEFPGSGMAARRARRGAPPPDDDFDYLDPSYDDAAYAADMARFGGEVTPGLYDDDPGFDDPGTDPERRQRIRHDYDHPGAGRYGYADDRGRRDPGAAQRGPGSVQRGPSSAQRGPGSPERAGRAAVPAPEQRAPGARPDQRDRVAGRATGPRTADPRDRTADPRDRTADPRDRITGPATGPRDRRDRVAELRPDQWGEWVSDDRDRTHPGARPETPRPGRPGRARVAHEGVIDGEWTEIPTADEDWQNDNGPIRRPGRNRRVSGDPLQSTSPAEREAIQPTSPATGRARVPASSDDDVLDLYKPRRDPQPGTDQGRPAAEHRGASGRPADHRDPSGTPRVISKTTPPAPPRVISKTAPPAAPKVIKKADPPTPPKVVGPPLPGTAPSAVPPAASAPTATPPQSEPRDPGRPDLAPPSQRRNAEPASQDHSPPSMPHRPQPGEPASPTVPLSRPRPTPTDQRSAPTVRPAAPFPAPAPSPAPAPAPAQRAVPAPTQPGTSPSAQPGTPTASAPPGSSAPTQPGTSTPAQPVPVSPVGQPATRPEDLRPTPLPTVPASPPARSGPAPQPHPGQPGTERPAWAEDQPAHGSGRITANVALPPAPPPPPGRHPITPPETHRRAEPTPINGAVPRQVDGPTPGMPRPVNAPAAGTPHRADSLAPGMPHPASAPTAPPSPAATPQAAAAPAPPAAAPSPAAPSPAGPPPAAATPQAGTAPAPPTPAPPTPARPVPPAPSGSAPAHLHTLQDTELPQAGRPPQPLPTQSRPGRHARPPTTPPTHSDEHPPGASSTGVPTPRSSEADTDAGAAAAPERLVPIGRLVTSGPDTTERQYADAEFGNTWFSPKKPVPPQRSGQGWAGADEPTTTEPQPTGAAKAGAAPQPADAAKTATPPQPADKARPATSPRPASGPAVGTDGVVIDLDITGLFHGYGVTAEQALIVPREANPAAPTVDDAGPTTGDKGRPESTPDEERQDPTAGGEEGTAQPSAGPPTPLSAADLEAIRWRLDGGTLREVVDDREALRDLGARLDEPLAEEQDNVARAGLLSVRAEVYRLLGELGMAAAASRLALAHAEAARDVQAIVIAQAELAHVLRLRGDFGEADRLFEQAASSEAPEVLRSVVHENAGRCCFDQGRLMEALDHFARAIRLGAPDDLDLVERIGMSLEAVYIHVLRDGWGPYPRLRSEILN